MKLVNKLNSRTILDFELFYSREEVEQNSAWILETYDNVVGFEETVMDGCACEADVECWENDVYLLEQYGIARITNVETILGCFTEAEQNAIIEEINSVIDEDCPFDSGWLWDVRYNTSWYTREEMLEMFKNDVHENYNLWNVVNDNFHVFDSVGELDNETGEFMFTRVFAMSC